MSEATIRSDGPYENVFLNVGTKGDRTAYTRAGAPRTLSNTELENLYTGDGFARRVIDLPAEEMVRAGFELEGIDDDEAVRAELEGIQVLPRMAEALKWADLYGGALVVMLVDDGGELITPLVEERVRSVEQLRVYDRWQVSRYQKYMDPNDKRFGKTEFYHVSPIDGTPYLVHESRCLVFDGVLVPARIREQSDGWGGSKLQQCYDQLIRFGMSHIWGNALMERAQQAVHGIPNLTDLLRQPGGEDLVKKRIHLVDASRSINNTVVIDSQETYDLKATSLTGVADLVDRFGLALSAVADMPESLLFGRPQAGLNASGKNDLENWYAKIGQHQQNKLLPQLDRLVALQLRAMGKYKDDYLIKFCPLYVPSRKDQAETENKEAQTAQLYHAMGALDASEIRKTLGDKGYEIDDVEEMPEGPDPEDANLDTPPANGQEDPQQPRQPGA